MKKFLVTLLAAAVFGGAFAQSTFPDIPENHWAGDAVDRIADLGIVIGFPDGTFRGNEAFTRYQSALVVSRLLDVIGDELDARQVLTNADLAALRNAVQELASDVADLDQRHSGEIAAISDDVAGNSARLDALENLVGAGDSEAMRDLQNQVASQRVAIDTAQAQAEAAEALAQDALDAARIAANRAAQNAEAIDALTWLSQDLNDRVDALEKAPRSAADLSGTDADIANIREFVILLRRDQIAMRDQIAALEDASAQHGADISDLQDRVASLEEDRITIGGSIAVNYRVDRMSGAGTPFDVDRAYGLGQDRDTGASIFSSGARSSTSGVPAAQRPAQFWTDIGEDFSSPVAATLSLTIGFGKTADAAGKPNALNNFDAVLVLELKRAFGVASNSAGTATFANAYVFSVKEFTSTFEGIGGAPITFDYGEEISVSFTPYVFFLDERPGFVATVSNPVGFLDFLDPTLTIAYSGNAADEFFRGASLTASPFAGVTLGGSFAQFATNADERDNLDVDNVETTVWGVDASAAISIFSLEAEYASSTETDNATDVTTDAESILYVEVGVDTANIPVLNSLSANYRDIAADWLAGNNGIQDADADDEYPFAEDQVGFGVNASLSLFIVDLEAYFDSYSTTAPVADVTAFGVDVTANIFRGLGVTGFFKQVSVGGTTVDTAERPVDTDNVAQATDSVARDVKYITGFGIGIKHDGASEDALLADLNFSAEYKQLEADFARRVIDVQADYEFSVAFLTLTPYAQFLSEVSPVDASPHTDNRTTIRAGTGLSTDEFNFFMRPSLEAAVNYRSTDHTDVNAAGNDYVATELQFSVGVKLNEFLFDNSTLTVRYGSWSGENVRETLTHGGASAQGIAPDTRFDADANNSLTQSVNGWEALWDYWDLQFAYGVYTSDNGVAATGGQVFRIKYTVDF
jgi:hypothetical protein